jgi:hypothetical protein
MTSEPHDEAILAFDRIQNAPRELNLGQTIGGVCMMISTSEAILD